MAGGEAPGPPKSGNSRLCGNRKELTADDPAAAAGRNDRTGKTRMGMGVGVGVVVVDGDAARRKSLRLPLEGAGYAVTEASTAESALEVIAQGHTGLVVAGVNPADWQGLTLIKKIRHCHPGLKVIAIAGGTVKASVEPLAALAETWGAAAILYRPFDGCTLKALAGRLTRGAGGAAISPRVALEADARPLPIPRPAPRARPPTGRLRR